jgi:diphthine methyl ester acylhydrolase
MNISSLQGVELDKPPCCVEFSPDSPSYFLVGTYDLQNTAGTPDSRIGDTEEELDNGVVQPQERKGSIVVFRISHDKM